MPKKEYLKKILIIGSGPIVIGQAAEFDYAGTQACKAIREEGIQTILVNSNPATIMTDKQIADKVYMEPLTEETVEEVIRRERPDGMLAGFGGQTGLNLAMEMDSKGILSRYNVELLGVNKESIKKAEDREAFKALMEEIGEPVPASTIATTIEECHDFIQKEGLPVIIRPASGRRTRLAVPAAASRRPWISSTTCATEGWRAAPSGRSSWRSQLPAGKKSNMKSCGMARTTASSSAIWKT